MEARKQALLAALRTFARQRPGLEFGNYGDWKAYSSEMRSITKDLAQAQRMMDAFAWRDSISADAILEAAKHAFSGRLTITESEPGQFVMDYCTGQYWPTEYRRAVCSVLSSVLWSHWNTEHDGILAGCDAIRKTARSELGRGIASRWFN